VAGWERAAQPALPPSAEAPAGKPAIPGSPEATALLEARRIQAAVRQTLAELGLKPGDLDVSLYDHPGQIADPALRAEVEAAQADGQSVGAFYKTTPGRRPRLALFTPELSTPQRAIELALHELVGHRGMSALFGRNPSGWYRLTEQLWKQLGATPFSPEDAQRLGYRSLTELADAYHRPENGQNYDPTTVEGRGNLVGEHLARLAERGIRPSWFQNAVGWTKKLIRNVTKDRYLKDITDDDVVRLLAESRKAARGPDAVEPMNSGISFAKRQNWGQVKLKDLFSEQKSLAPKDPTAMPRLNLSSLNDTQILDEVEKWITNNPFQKDPWGNEVRIANPERGSIRKRAEHLSASRDRSSIQAAQQTRIVSDDKASTVAAVAETVRDPHAVVYQHGSFIYLRKYANGQWHAVFTDGSGGVVGTKVFDAGMLSQRALDFEDGLKTGVIVALRNQPARFRFVKP
jgi:hypothetical protein